MVTTLNGMISKKQRITIGRKVLSVFTRPIAHAHTGIKNTKSYECAPKARTLTSSNRGSTSSVW